MTKVSSSFLLCLPSSVTARELGSVCPSHWTCIPASAIRFFRYPLPSSRYPHLCLAQGLQWCEGPWLSSEEGVFVCEVQSDALVCDGTNAAVCLGKFSKLHCPPASWSLDQDDTSPDLFSKLTIFLWTQPILFVPCPLILVLCVCVCVCRVVPLAEAPQLCVCAISKGLFTWQMK